MKKMCTVLLVAVLATSCGKEEVSVTPQKVNTMPIEQTKVENYSEYSGFLLASDVKKYSFMQGGQILNVNVQKGDIVKTGDVLAELDPKLMDIAKNNAAASKGLAENQSVQAGINVVALQKSISAEEIVLGQAEDGLEAEKLKLNSLKNTYEKNIKQLEENFGLLEDNYEKNQKLYEVGAISQNDLNNLKTQYNNTKEELETLKKDYQVNENLQNIAINNARSNVEAQKIKIKAIEEQINAANVSKSSANLQVEQAGLGLEQYDIQLEDMTLKATMDGSVVDIIMQAGEVTGAGTPVVIVKSNTKVVKVGVPIEDYKNIVLGGKVIISFNDVEFDGKVTSIGSYPDETTKTYEVEVEVEENDIPLGSLVNVKFPTASSNGVFVPINSIVNKNGVNYVYIVNEESLVERREVTLGTVSNEKVEVQGLDAGTKLILDNFSQLRENDVVTVE